jgi:hypothetical protein
MKPLSGALPHIVLHHLAVIFSEFRNRDEPPWGGVKIGDQYVYKIKKPPAELRGRLKSV